MEHGQSSKNEGLRFGPLTDAMHVCVDMQRLFAEDTPWKTPWMERVLPKVVELVSANPRACVFTRFIPAPGPKYDYKLAWMDRLKARAAALIEGEETALMLGDFNVIPEPRDCWDPAAWALDALFLPDTRAAFRRVTHLGFTDALRAVDQSAGMYTFWDYQAGAYQRNRGIRIDHILLTPQAADRLETCGIDTETRGRDKPSDHVPIWVTLEP